MTDGPYDASVRARFMAKVRVDRAGCWRWMASLRPNGYGQFWAAGRIRSSHRVSWELAHGEPIPQGLDVDHLCRNRACVNPAHLEPVTRRENLRRAPSSPLRRTCCANGHEYTPENTYTGMGYRECRECWRQGARRAKARRKDGAS